MTQSMQFWRQALEVFPEHKSLIEECLEFDPRVSGFWFELLTRFEEAYVEPINEDVIARTFEFGLWCLAESNDEEVQTAAIHMLYEELPKNPAARRDLPNRLTRENFLGLMYVFKYPLPNDDERKAFIKEFLENTNNPKTAQSLKL
jgi:hypothetical protein